ncbi:hypothetical protein PIIN_06048 [Serendipita indica DSM 11827]|uniref:Uncharacterized protein n=1 Tax=Serendipita indica (strain DSM 11827) TaxID=1109443 RepID=G4TLB9_SERID|nr:hypothetical protein PIIN_06048 [Serendipita indica DSM 11827]
MSNNFRRRTESGGIGCPALETALMEPTQEMRTILQTRYEQNIRLVGRNVAETCPSNVGRFPKQMGWRAQLDLDRVEESIMTVERVVITSKTAMDNMGQHPSRETKPSALRANRSRAQSRAYRRRLFTAGTENEQQVYPREGPRREKARRGEEKRTERT